MMKRLFTVLALCLFASIASAADVYITDATSGGDTGADCANAHSASWFNSNAVGGNTYHLCGTFTGTAGSTKLTPPSGTAGNVLTVVFEADGVLTAPYWGTNGAIQISGKSYITIDGNNAGIIQNTANGTALDNQQASNGINISASDHITIQKLTIDNVYQNGGSDPASTDGGGVNTNDILLSGSGNNILIDNNTLKASRAGIRYDFDSDTLDTITFSNNIITDHCWGIAMASGGTNTNSGRWVISGNDISEWLNWQCPANAAYCTDKTDRYHTDGMILYQPRTNVAAFQPLIFNNYIHGDLGKGSPTAFIYCTYGGGASGTNGASCRIYNNLLVYIDGGVSSTNHWGISTGGSTDGHLIYNNTVVGKSSSVGAGMMLSSTNTEVKNNIVASSKYGIASYSTAFTTDGYTIDNNVYYNINTGTESYMFHQDESSPTAPGDYWTWAQWQAAGFDATSQYVDPLFVGSGDYSLQVGSTAIDNGADLSAYFITDYAGNARPAGAAFDIGAYEYGSGDGTPSAFSFGADVTGAELSTLTPSPDNVTVAGIDAGQTPAITVSGTGCEYSIDGAAFTSDAGTVGLDNVVALHTTSSASHNATITCTVTIGGVSDSWGVTTKTYAADTSRARKRAGGRGGWR